MAHLQPPMTMMDFFRKSEGIWFTQRAVHHFDLTADESGESNLFVTVIEKDDPRVEKVCAQQGIDPANATGGATFHWQPVLDFSEPNPNYAAVLIDIPNRNNNSRGKLIRDRGYVEGIPVVSHYDFAPDGVLTIETDYDNNQGQERCWFITDDFRVRVSNVRMMNGVNLIAYCSERRCVTPEMLAQMTQQNLARAF